MALSSDGGPTAILDPQMWSERGTIVSKQWIRRGGSAIATESRRVSKGAGILTLRWTVDEWFFDVRADEWLSYVMDDVLETIVDLIRAGKRPDTGGNLPRLAPGGWAEKYPGRKGARAMRTGFFPDHILRTEIRGRTDRATCEIRPPWQLAAWAVREYDEHGVDYFAAGRELQARVIETSREWVEAAADSGQGTFDTEGLRAAREARQKKPKRREGALRRRGGRLGRRGSGGGL